MSDTLEDIDTSQLDNVGRVKVDTPSNVTILDMTEDCTRLVFDRLTLNQLIHLRAVCHAWNHIITDICAKKHSIQLFFFKGSVLQFYFKNSYFNFEDGPQFELNKKNLLLITEKIHGPNSQKALKRARGGSFCEQQNDTNLGIRFIAGLFPNITNFVCDFKYDRMFELNYILWKWSTNLDTLTLILNTLNKDRICKNAYNDFVKCFEQLNSLRRLHLFGDRSKLDLPNALTFGQLEEFTFDNPNQMVAPYFVQLNAKSCKILRIGRYSKACVTPTNRAVNALNFLDDAKPTHKLLHYAQFQNLIHLEIHQHCESLADVLQQIVSLPKLQTLVLELCSFERQSEMKLHHNNPNYRNTFSIFHNTITELHLMDNLQAHFSKFYGYKLLERTFPMVRKIYICSNNLDKDTFDAQFRPRFNEAFGERIEVTFFQNKIFNFQNIDIDSILSRV